MCRLDEWNTRFVKPGFLNQKLKKNTEQRERNEHAIHSGDGWNTHYLSMEAQKEMEKKKKIEKKRRRLFGTFFLFLQIWWKMKMKEEEWGKHPILMEASIETRMEN